ncbi:MAG TPA: hypothetical protein VIX73_28795 [Kofleriaceae bacterium]
MHVLVIGGNRFLGRGLVWQLLCRGHRVTLVNSGRLPDPFGERVERIHVDRSTDAFDRALAGRTFDRAVDLAGRHEHESCPWPARETDYDGATMSAPPSPADHDDWAYGIGKRGAEDVLAAATSLPTTRLRIPMVNAQRDRELALAARS